MKWGLLRIYSLSIQILLAAGAFAQTGPAGIMGPADNSLWLRADRATYRDAGVTEAIQGENVQQWNDLSGNGRHALQATAGYRPDYVKNAVNGLPALRFISANADKLVSTGLDNASQASVWVVAQYSTLPSANPGLIQGATTGNALSSEPGNKNLGMWVSSAGQVWGRGIQSNGTTRNVPATTSLTANTWYVLNANYYGTSITQYVNNAAAGAVTYDATLKPWPDVAVGVQAGSEGWNGHIAEVIIFKAGLNRAQRIILGNHLSAKYGTILGAHDLYVQDNVANGNYDHEVAGIGRTMGVNEHLDAKGSGHVRINAATNLGNNKFLLWGHDHGQLGTFSVSDIPTGVQGRWGRVWRVSEVDTMGLAVDVGAVDMTFDLSSFGPVIATDLRLLVDTDNDGTFADETPIAGAVSAGAGHYRFPGITALTNGRRFTLGTANLHSTPLPIELLTFEAALIGRSTVELQWRTATEQDNAYFTVERSTDLATWTSLGNTPGAGNSTSITSYSDLDHAPEVGVNYYRLRQTDLNGTSTLSPIVPVEVAAAPPSLSPNPALDHVVVRWPSAGKEPLILSVIDLMGRVVIAPARAGGPLPRLDVAALPPGRYLLRMERSGVREVVSFQVAR